MRNIITIAQKWIEEPIKSYRNKWQRDFSFKSLSDQLIEFPSSLSKEYDFVIRAICIRLQKTWVLTWDKQKRFDSGAMDIKFTIQSQNWKMLKETA